jgi:hypothetical protein
MKNSHLFLFLLALVSLCSCQDTQDTINGGEGTSITIDPLSCQTGGEKCDMNWNIEKSRNKFPDNIEILINDKKIFDECLREGNVGITRGTDTVSIIIWKFLRLDGTQDFKFQINDLKDCYSTKSDFYSNLVQNYDVKTINGEKQVLISL